MSRWNSVCLACGTQMAPCLVRAASVRCHDCRDEQAPLRAELVEHRLYIVQATASPETEIELEEAA